MRRMSAVLGTMMLALVSLASPPLTEAFPQDDEIRDITNGKLIAARQNKAAAKPRRRPYRPRRTSAPKPTQPLDSELGLTTWKFRRSQTGDEVRPLGAVSGARPGSPETAEEWTPIRTQATEPLRKGQIVRFTVEAPRSGYLYVIGRDRGPDGYFDPPMVMFPQRENDDNLVMPGKPISIPAWSDTDQVYYTLSTYPKQTHIDLVVLVLPAKLPAYYLQSFKESLKIQPSPFPITDAERQRLARLKLNPISEVYTLDTAQVDRMVRTWSAPLEWLDAMEGEGKALTRRELTASLDPSSPLTQDDDGPQTLVRIARKLAEPWLVVMPLEIVK